MTSPAVSGPNSNLSSQGLSYGTREITGPTEFVGPPLDATNVVGTKTRVAVTAAQPVVGDTTLDPASAVDLSGAVHSDGLVHWSVPAGRWLLFGFWSRPSGQLPNSLYGLAQARTSMRSRPPPTRTSSSRSIPTTPTRPGRHSAGSTRT
jgi:hypothetical protein